MLEIRNLSAHYGPVRALEDVSLKVGQGEIVSLIGANGAGKSTLLMSICGQPQPSGGDIILDGRSILGIAMDEIVRLGVAHAPEGRRIFPHMTVYENLQLGAFAGAAKFFTTDLERIYNLFPRLQERRNQRGGTLSGGEQQMLAIARALMSRPRLLLLDEPSLGLAPLIVKQIFQVLKDLNSQTGMTIFLVEQNAHQALRLANRAYVLANGKIVLSGTGAELLANPDIQRHYLEGA